MESEAFGESAFSRESMVLHCVLMITNDTPLNYSRKMQGGTREPQKGEEMVVRVVIFNPASRYQILKL